MIRPYKLWSNYWGNIANNGFYARSRDYNELIGYERMYVCACVCVCVCTCVWLSMCIHVCVYYLCVRVGLWVYCNDVMWNNLTIPLCTQRGMECPIHQWCCAVQRRMAGQPLPKLSQQLLRPRHGMVPMDERPGEHPSL